MSREWAVCHIPDISPCDIAYMVAHELARSPICSVPAMCQGIPGWWKPYIAWVQVCSYTVIFHGTCMHHKHRLHGLVTYPPFNRVAEKIVALVAVFYLQCITAFKLEIAFKLGLDWWKSGNRGWTMINDLRSSFPLVVSGDAPVGCWDGVVPGLSGCGPLLRSLWSIIFNHYYYHSRVVNLDRFTSFYIDL